MKYQDEVRFFGSKAAIQVSLGFAPQTKRLKKLNGPNAQLYTLFIDIAPMKAGTNPRVANWREKVTFMLSEKELTQFGQWLLGRFEANLSMPNHHSKVLYLNTNIERGMFGITVKDGNSDYGAISLGVPQSFMFRMMPLTLKALSGLTLQPEMLVYQQLKDMPLSTY